MATKTSSKTATRRPATPAGPRKTTAAPKPAIESKSKVQKKKLAGETASASTAAKSPTPPSQKGEPRRTSAPAQEHESVSLIDKKKPRKKTEDGKPKLNRDILPPISRIRASLDAPAAPQRVSAPVEAAPAQSPAIQEPGVIAAETTAPPSAEPEAPQQKVILIKPPIVVKQLATELGLKPHQLISELMTYNIFANINQTVEPDIASKIAENHGFILEKERREKGAGVHKVEQVVVAPPPPVIEKKE